MKPILLTLLICMSICLNTTAQQIHIACLGNSITFGATIQNRAHNSFPAQLQAMLGNEYKVTNFGVSGCTLLSKGDIPYIKTGQFQKALDSNPDIIFIKLGTNDSKPQNRQHLNEFKTDYKTLIARVQKLPSHPRIILLTPIPAFTQPDTSGITASVIEKQILPTIEEIAFETGVEIIHLFPLFANAEQHIMPDRIHPSSIGAGIIATRLYEYLLAKHSDKTPQTPTEGKTNNFYGYPCHTYEQENIQCKIVTPRWTAEGQPWVWRARFWGHQPQTDIALLEHGFHIVYTDIADLFGSPEAVKRWNRFYNNMQQIGLSPKVALEGMSRGGLIIYNWAVENPEKIACIYADAPVLDIKSWPMGGGKREPSETDVKTMMQAYAFKNKQEAIDYRRNPLDRAAEIAKGAYPILHVCGEADNIVPVAENTNIFEQCILENGGKIKIIRKTGVNHHPHSLKNPTPIVDFILRATGQKINTAILPAQGNEYRAGAGWTQGSDWWANHIEITERLQHEKIDLLLIGNSITQGFGGKREIITHKPGQEQLNAALPAIKWENAGISGDRTQYVLYRILHGKYEIAQPKNVLLTIGINNLYSGENNAEETAAGITACADAIIEKMPEANLILYGVLPAGREQNSRLRLETIETQRHLKTLLEGKKLTYINLYDLFVNTDGTLKESLYSGDFLHLNKQGYKIWADEIAKQL